MGEWLESTLPGLLNGEWGTAAPGTLPGPLCAELVPEGIPGVGGVCCIGDGTCWGPTEGPGLVACCC